MIIPEDEFWLPISIGHAMGEPIVTIARLRQPPNGFISDVDLRKSGTLFNIPLHDIDDQSLDSPNIDGVIFHLPRSGSTAVARAVACIANSSCYFEPCALDQLLSPQLKHIENRKQSLSKLLRLYSTASRHMGAKTFIKLSSWSTLNISEYREALPETPFFFVYRNPVEILVQILDRPTGWMQSPAKENLEQVLGFGTSSSLLEYCGRMLKLFCEQILLASPSPVIISHESLRDSTLSAIRQNVSFQLSENDLSKMRASFELNSEYWDSSIKYLADANPLRAQASDEIVLICERFITPYLSKLKTLHNDK